MSDTTLVVVVALAMAVGVAGTVVPLVPGIGLVWLAALVYGLVDGFGVVGSIVFVTISAIAVAGIVAGIALPHHAARWRRGAMVHCPRSGNRDRRLLRRTDRRNGARGSAWDLRR